MVYTSSSGLALYTELVKIGGCYCSYSGESSMCYCKRLAVYGYIKMSTHTIEKKLVETTLIYIVRQACKESLQTGIMHLDAVSDPTTTS